MDISYISTDKLLGLVHDHGTIGKTKRTWTFMHREEGGVTLLPTYGTRYLYRGQTKRYSPCLPAIARHVKKFGRTLGELSRDEALGLLANLIRADCYCSELRGHPVFEWAKSQSVHIPQTEFAQHYGVPTGLIDVTESLEVALFFATHEFRDGIPHPCTEGTGILYRFDWASAPPQVTTRFKPIAIQPFPRPFRQWAWSCELMLGESFEASPGLIAVEFAHDESFANEIRALAEAGGELFPPDLMADVAAVIRRSTVFPRAIATRVLTDITSDPGGLRETVEDLCRALEHTGFCLSDSAPRILDEAQMAQLHTTWLAEKPSWDAAIASGFELLFVRSRHDATQHGTGADAQ